MKTEILPIDSVKQHLLIPYDSFSQMSTIYLTCIKIRAVQSRIRAASAGYANFNNYNIPHSRTQSPSYARCDEGLWPNPKPETIKTW